MNRLSAKCLGTLAFGMLLAAPIGAAAAGGPARVNWNLTPEQISSSCATAIATAQKRVNAQLAARGRRTFANSVRPLEDLTADLNDSTVAQTFLFNVSESKPVRDASLRCNDDESNFFSDLAAQPELYAQVAAARRSGTARDAFDRQLTAYWMDTLKRSGAGLAAPQRTEFVKLSKQLNDLQNRYAENLGNDATKISITAAQTQSLPPDFVAKLVKNADGTYNVPVGESTTKPFMQNERDESARKTFFIAYNSREADANTPLLEQAIDVRDRLAHLLGYQTWAAYQLSDRLAKTPARVFSFLNDLDAKLLPKAREEIATLTTLKAKQTGDPSATLQPWDIAYYDNQLNKTQYAVDNNAIRQYFPVRHTIDAVLGIYHRLLGVTFTAVSKTDAWNPDVLEYRVSDTKTRRFLGTTYFDLYPRPGKYKHFANFGILPVRKVGGVYRAPFVAILGNWPKPAPGYPALLSHDEVVTFFHEFGHNMASLLTVAPYETLSSGFLQDFVEAPSQMLENFVWQPSVLKQISSNASTGAPLPDSLIASMIRARYVDDAYFTTRQIMLALLDMKYHTSGPHVDTTAVWAQVARADTPVPLYPGTQPQAAFGHLMGGYDAGYYGYLFSKVYAQDMFTAFLKGGLENPVVGMRYRRDILEPARTLDPDTEVTHFLGRPMNPEAFYAEFGIAPEPAKWP